MSENESLDQFDEGFELGENSEGGQEAGDEASHEKPQEQTVIEEQTKPEQDAEFEQSKKNSGQTPESNQAAVEIDEAIAAEYEVLKKLNPEAASIAIEDSADGAALRSRLEHYGAEQAQDRAEFLIYRRREEARKAEREKAEREAHNRKFFDVMQKEVPDYCEMLKNPQRKSEAAAYIADVYKWIEQKPFKEASQMMEIAKSGRDPVQVSSLIKRFEREKKNRNRDYDDALAVPSRGISHMGSGIGDKDDFDAGWNLHA